MTADKLATLSNDILVKMLNSAMHMEPADVSYFIDRALENDFTDLHEAHATFSNNEHGTIRDDVPPVVTSLVQERVATFPLQFMNANNYVSHRIALIR
jgi:hypothetical protein